MHKTFILSASALPAAVLARPPYPLPLSLLSSPAHRTSCQDVVVSHHVNTVSGVIFNVNATPTAAASTSLAIRLHCSCLLHLLLARPPSSPSPSSHSHSCRSAVNNLSITLGVSVGLWGVVRSFALCVRGVGAGKRPAHSNCILNTAATPRGTAL